VHVDAGNTQATFPIRTELVGSSTSVTISARHAATTRTQTLTVLPPVDGDVFTFGLQDISAWGTVPPNDSFPFQTGRTSGSGSQSATLQSSSPLVLSVPSTTTFTNGITSGSFSATTYNVSVPTDVTITGTYRGMVARQRVTVDDSGLPVVTAIVVSSVVGGNDVEASIALNTPAPYGGYTVTLTGSRSGLATVPATVTVPEGEEGATFTITTQPTTTTRGVLVQTIDGTVIRSAVFAVNPPPALRHDSPLTTTVSEPLIAMTSAATTPRVATNTIPVAVSKYSLYTSELQLLAETVPTNLTNKPITYEYIWFAGTPAAQIESATNTIHYYFNDHLGTPILTTSSAATVDWRIEREPYGTTTVVRTGAARYQPLAFPGQEIVDDRAYNVFRWYRGGWGRYTQADPLGVGGAGHFERGRLRQWQMSLVPKAVSDDIQSSIPLYSYAGDNPINSFDQTGLEKIHCYVSLLWQGKGKCIYGGFCWGLFSDKQYVALGGVHVESCTKCSPKCDYYSQSWSVSAPEDWHCIPPMKIIHTTPDPPIADW